MVVAVVQPSTISPSDTPLEHEDTYVKQLWHSLEEALHLREPVPPPVPPKDERWMVHTVDLSISPQDEEDVHFWDKLTLKFTSRYHQYILQQESVSIDVPTEAALNHLGNQGTEDDLQQQRAYFKRMSRLCQQKFEYDNALALKEQQETKSLVNAETEDTQQEQHHQHRHHRILSSLKSRLHGRRHSAELVPQIDPEEMKAAHRLMYGHSNNSSSSVSLVLGSHTTVSESEDSWGRSMFGLWWGHRRHGNSEAKDTLGEDDWEKVDVPKHKADKKESLREQNGLVPTEPEPQSQSQTHRHHIHLGRRTPKTDASVLGSSLTVDQRKHNQKATLRRHQALAAAAAYEAMKAYQAKKIRQGKKVSHGEMKAILAGMAMAEAVKLLESKHLSDSDSYDMEGDDDAVAEAGSKVLKLFELLRSP